jgi:solute carrier family 25 phosphate transporter 23/24/25/41
VDKDGDINVSFPRAPGSTSTSTALFGSKADKEKDQDEAADEDDDFEDTVDESAPQVDHHEAWRFLLAGGVAGAGTSSPLFWEYGCELMYSITIGHCAI